MHILQDKRHIAHDDNVLWNLIRGVEDRLHIRSHRRATTTKLRQGKIRKEYTGGMEFFKNARDLDKYMQDL